MNRWLVKTNDKSLRYPTFKWYAPTIQEVQNQFPEAEITQDFDKSYLDYIEKIKAKSEYNMVYDRKGREVYAFKVSDGHLVVKLSKDEDGFFWYVGRADDVIKSSGYRIGPFEIESGTK